MQLKNFKLLAKIYEKGLNQSDFAQRIKIGSESKLSRLINGRIQPTDEEVEKICEFLKCPKEDINL